MAKTTEEIFREAREKNKRLASTSKSDSSESWKDDYYMTLTETEPPTFSSSMNNSPKFSNNKWYEKNWLIWFLLIFLCPVGLIWLWKFARYSVRVKWGITVVFVLLMLIGYSSDSVQSNTYEIGYLKRGSTWLDEYRKWNYSPNTIQIEIWNRHIVTSDGETLIQIFFLEGDCKGSWGYTRENFLSR